MGDDRGGSLGDELAERCRASLGGGDAEGAEPLQERAGARGGRAWQGADFTTDQLAMRHVYPDARRVFLGTDCPVRGAA